MKWRAVLQGGKPPREALRDEESSQAMKLKDCYRLSDLYGVVRSKLVCVSEAVLRYFLEENSYVIKCCINLIFWRRF